MIQVSSVILGARSEYGVPLGLSADLGLQRHRWSRINTTAKCERTLDQSTTR